MQESVKKNEVKPSQKGLKLFIFLLFVAGITYFIYKFNIDLSILKGISREFLAILEVIQFSRSSFKIVMLN